MWRQVGIALLAAWLPTSGFTTELGASGQATPEITGSLEGERREWFVLSHGSDSNASFVELGDDINIDITGSVDGEAWESDEALSISLTVAEEQLTNAVVIYAIGTSVSPPLFTSEGGDVAVTLTHYERTSQAVHVAGKIEGLMALQVALGEPASLEEGIEIDVAFDVEAQKIEF
ncbi:hypothetical protein ACFIOZ_12515 [Vreelandella sp. F11]|uniref:hypothetical protein n=1 Tax=Vreelandella sp. F11 TaxID=3394751 RepID=UPI0036DA1FC6